MAEWFPTYIVTGGLYAGQTPSGNLDGFMQELNPHVLGSLLLGSVDYTYTPSDPATTPHSWTGSFGQNEEAFRAYGDAHKDEGDVSTIVQIFTIPNPPDAQFYKQELVVYGAVREITQPGIDPSTLEEFVIHAYDFGISRIYRREYATPTAIPVVTDEFFGGGAAYGQSNMRYIAFGYPTDPGTIMKRFRFAVSYYEKDNVNYLCWCFYGLAGNLVTTYYHYACVGVALPVLNTAFGAFKLDENDDPNIDPDPGDDPGLDPPPGPGPRQPEYDPIPEPDLPGLDAIGAGFLTLYSPSKTLLNLLADEIFSTNILDIIKNYFASIQELIAGLTILPFHVPVSGFAHHKIGLFTSEVALPLVRSQWFVVDCGSVFVQRYFNNFLDQSPNTKIMLWLPYIGYQQLDADEVMGNTISVKYHCDVLSGACVAFVMIGNGGTGADTSRVIAQYSGNVITQVPVASESFDSLVSNAINILTAGVGIAAGSAIGGIGAAGSGASMAQATAGASQISSAVGAQVGMGMGGTAANMVMSMKPTYSRNGTPGSTAGYMSVQKPYLIKIVPRDAVASNHIQLKGYPSNYGGTLGSLSGYAEVSEIHLQGISASVDETTEIYSLLKGGVII